MSKCRWTGRRPPPTSSPANISTASWARPSARPAWRNWCSAWSTPSPTGARRTATSRPTQDGENFRIELAHLMLTQKACFNSPVWFNVGVKETRGYGWIYDEQPSRVTKLESGVMRPQCSACFIVSVKDSLESILDLAKTEGMLFKWGSGTGSNLSALREEDAMLSGGGRACGPLTFMKGFDAFAGVIKCGGKTRRAAKMVILNVGSSRCREVHLVQGQGREEGLHAGGSRLRLLARRRSLQLHLLPERQQLACAPPTISWKPSAATATGGPRPSPPASR